MIFDLSHYAGHCACGETHRLSTRAVLLEAGATQKLSGLLDELGLTAGGVVVCDRNTACFADGVISVLGGRLLPSGAVTLDPDGLHADEKATETLDSLLLPGVSFLLAVGSGTIHDITRYIAHRRRIPFVSYPTAASVDGFVSTVSAMTWYGFKKTMPGVAPVCVVADTDVFARAPYRLTASGVSDVLGKYTALADWQIAHLVTGERVCPRIMAMSREAADKVRENMRTLRAGGADAMEKLMFALLLSGIAMQMWGNSRPASGAEHHLSHLWEMEVINRRTDAMHGEKVGVGLCKVIDCYRRLLFSEVHAVAQYDGLPHARLRTSFGALYSAIAEENTPDILCGVQLERLEAQLPAIRHHIAALPEPAVLSAEMAAAGCCTELAQIGLPADILEDSLTFSPYVRSRMTLMRLRALLRG